MAQVTTATIWSTLHSLNVALNLKNIGFANLDIVSLELVKFLLVNTGYESITILEKKVEELQKDKADLQKSLKGAVTSASTAANKLDKLKKRLDGYKNASKS